MQVLRARLSDLSWLMRCLAEPIARRANREDACKGRFWEGRFKAQRLCDERALIAAMAYVDLNPIRAGIAQSLNASAHTSASARIMQVRADREALRRRLGPILGVQRPSLGIGTADYLQMIDWTGRQLAPGKRGRMAGEVPTCLKEIDPDPFRWTTRVRAIGSGYWRVVGSAQDLGAFAFRIGQRWLKGLRLAEALD